MKRREEEPCRRRRSSSRPSCCVGRLPPLCRASWAVASFWASIRSPPVRDSRSQMSLSLTLCRRSTSRWCHGLCLCPQYLTRERERRLKQKTEEKKKKARKPLTWHIKVAQSFGYSPVWELKPTMKACLLWGWIWFSILTISVDIQMKTGINKHDSVLNL